jgi:omega-6 fatty acid desaturase (delta-12 desaturase)
MPGLPGLPADPKTEPAIKSARDWMPKLAEYRRPSHTRSFVEIIITGGPFVAFWIAAWWTLSISYWLTLLFAVPAALFLMRLFMIQHDCGHGAFFRRQFLNDWVGRAIGVFSLTPYDVWRRAHAIHHATSGNLDKRGVGDIETLTVAEYQALSRRRRILYRLYRNPLVMFGLGPTYNFVLRHRLPFGFMRDGWKYWISAMGTNIAMAGVIAVMIYAIGLGPFLLIQLPITLLATTMGVWLFFVQHQFEDTLWATNEEWTMHDAALYGSSHYVLPPVLRWFTANISIHHVHHLASRIPYYRLGQVLRDHPELAAVRPITFWKSFTCARLQLWDEGKRKLVSFAKAREARKN